jgi:hypothetical protein
VQRRTPQGTNNQRLLNDPLYVGLKQRRIGGTAYYELLDEVGGRGRVAGGRFWAVGRLMLIVSRLALMSCVCWESENGFNS